MSEDSVISRYCIDTTPWFLVWVMSDFEVGERSLCDVLHRRLLMVIPNFGGLMVTPTPKAGK